MNIYRGGLKMEILNVLLSGIWYMYIKFKVGIFYIIGLLTGLFIGLGISFLI